MNVFDIHKQIIDEYEQYIRSFITIADPEIQAKVEEELKKGKLWPQPLLHFNPSYESAGPVKKLADAGGVHKELADVFTGYDLHLHQKEAIELGVKGKDFVVTSGTGSGKSLTYIGTIFDDLLKNPDTKGVKAVVVYPLNALINSQTEEFNKYRDNYQKATGKDFPISYGQYTGQEREDRREQLRKNPPQILLTNFMMLELLLTRSAERSIRDAIFENLKFLVFDELHTYRGRQGADVGMLIRRIRSQCASKVTCIGTSATMIAGGTIEDQQGQVAKVASDLFGKALTGEQVVNEKLSWSLAKPGLKIDKAGLAAAIRNPINPQEGEDALRKHTVAQWLELNAALEQHGEYVVRRKPQSISALTLAMADASGCTPDECRTCLAAVLLWISTVNERLKKDKQPHTILPYRLHQFLAQTGSVYTTLDQGAERFITLEPGRYKADDSNKKPIFPNVFSRASGHPFICVRRQGDKLVPREFMDLDEDEEAETEDGYLIVGEQVWNPEEDLEALPDTWFRISKSGITPRPEREEYFPKKLYFNELGECSDTEPMRFEGWYMKARLLFDPTAGVFFDAKTREGTKLTKLGSEGRSTSTTITAFSILGQLKEAGYTLRDQRLLSFTDNRQDAALQAGHFNDFVQVVRLRSAIHSAVKNAEGGTLNFAKIGTAVFEALRVPITEYTHLEKPPAIAKVQRQYEETFKDFLVYRVLADLRRSWRIVLPNLEQCALLNIAYKDLGEVAKEKAFWADLPIVSDLNQAKRFEFLETVLDFFRLEYAIHSNNFLDHAQLKENEKRFREELKSPWSLDKKEELRTGCVIRLDRLSPKSNLASQSMGPTSALGKFIKQFVKQEKLDPETVRGDHYAAFILKLMDKLREADYLHESKAPNRNNEQVPVYRLKIDRILWKAGDRQTVKADVIKRRSFRNLAPKPNLFFQDLYSREFGDGKRLLAGDHTGQLDFDTRRDREDKFRCDWYTDETKAHYDEERIRRDSLSALFCSPTMELGIDIGGLSVVHMRNAPPNPANYAQRSGRAGRSGQGALVFTYCSSYSPHDRHYFEAQAELVAGAVQPPKLDLCNEELLLTHLHALAITEIGLPGLDSETGKPASLTSLLDMNAAGMPLLQQIVQGLKLSPTTFDTLRATFRRTVKDFEHELQKPGKAWYSDGWIDRNLSKLAQHLDEALSRWRSIFQSARSMLTDASKKIESGIFKASSDEYKQAQRQQNQATHQLTLLKNESERGSTQLSEFYPYRYLAAEGFLPGYNFTRLPIRIYIPTGSASGEFISRPRAIALREFGPLNIIYHNGSKYRVDQMIIQDPEQALKEAKVSTKAGYFLIGDQKSLEICPFSGASLADNANKRHIHDLHEIVESRATEVDRISCEEEERVSRGFEIDTFFTVDGSLERVRNATAKSGDSPLLRLRYIPSARLVYVSNKWRSTQFEGFPIGMTTGFWRSKMPDDPTKYKETYRPIRLWTHNVADALYIEPVEALGLGRDGVITLEYALKRAIETEFQIESNELGVEVMGTAEAPNILLFEAAEGSLGVLSQLSEDAKVFHRVINAAKAICRYDDPKYLAPASYDDLLSYYNQRHHQSIDRFLIRDALDKLLACTVELQAGGGYADYDAQYKAMLEGLDANSSTERKFIDYLYKNGLRLPDAAQKKVEGIYVQPDFFYEPRIWVFCDGTPHDNPDAKAQDKLKRQEIRARGDEVIVYYYKDKLDEFVSKRPDIFRKVR